MTLLYIYIFNRSDHSTSSINKQKALRLLSHFVDEDTTLFDIFKTFKNENNDEKTVNLNGNSATASANKTHFVHIERQQNNQINSGERNCFNLTSFDASKKEKTSIESTEGGNESDYYTRSEIDLKSSQLKRYFFAEIRKNFI